jgi:hypothetical protein
MKYVRNYTAMSHTHNGTSRIADSLENEKQAITQKFTLVYRVHFICVKKYFDPQKQSVTGGFHCQGGLL